MILDFLDLLNWAAVGVSLVIAFLIGAVYFLPRVMGGVWARQVFGYAGIPENETISGSSRPGPVAKWLASIAVNAVILALVVRAVGAESLGEGLVVGIVFWLGFGATSTSWPPIFARMPWKWWLVNNGAFLSMQVAMGAILGAWQ